MKFEIPVHEQTALFKKYLAEEDNDRIIFSGPFGIGKTYFLDKYFGQDNTDYLTIKLAPVNYSISNTEDIFKLIKYDILFELGRVHSVTYEQEPVSRSVAIGTLLPGKASGLIAALTPMLALLDKASSIIPAVLTALGTMVTYATTVAEEIEKQRLATGKVTDATDLGDEVANSYHFELDYATEFIESNLNELQAKKGATYKVLVIDDLDRIDPEHIFRLFNIFSAHFDYNKTQKNKFGFDKIIFVCDIHNVRNIFHNRYGMSTDFTGYIDKFFSTEIFFYSIEKGMALVVDDFIKAIDIPHPNEKSYFDIYVNRNLSTDYNSRSLLNVILTELILSGSLKLRRFTNGYGLKLSVSGDAIKTWKPFSSDIQTWHIPAITILEILSRIMGGGEVLAKGIQTITKYKKSLGYRDTYDRSSAVMIGYLLPIADYKNHKFKTRVFATDLEHKYTGGNGQQVSYALHQHGPTHDLYYANLQDNTPQNISQIDFFGLLSQALEVLLSEGIIR